MRKDRLQKGMVGCLGILWALVLLACGAPSPDPYFQQLRSRDPEERTRAAYELLRFGNEIVPRLIQESGSDYTRVRYVVVQLMGKVKDQRSVPTLIERLGDKSANVAAKAAWALAELQDPRALGPLLQYAGDASKGVRSQVTRGLGTCHSYAAEPALSDSAYAMVFKALRDPTPAVRISALLGIRSFGYRDATEQIIRMSRDPAAEVRHVAVQALGQIAAGEAPGAAPVAAQRVRDNIFEALIVSLDEPAYPTIRIKAVRALELLADPRMVPYLEKLAAGGSEEDRREANRALEKFHESALATK
ncbi:MAG: hypothetical protein GKR89_22915 [Candidatus Latescibacteria bacterium]|nr:hypothetical protein [Candidatus Latescibacterota bacterium]